MVDLVAHSNYQSINGYTIQPSPANLLNPNVRSVLIGNKNPAFSWQINSTAADVAQEAYQVLVSDDEKLLGNNKGNVWDSGKIQSIQSSAVIFKGIDLKPSTAYYWTVRVWTNKEKGPSPYAKPIAFYTDSVLSEYKLPSYPTEITEQKPVRLTKSNGVYFADFGKDAFGQLKLDLFSDTNNKAVIIRLGETLDADGGINRKPPGNVRYAQYKLNLLRGMHAYKVQIVPDKINTKPGAVKIPAYIGEVTPFRYCEIEGCNGEVEPENITRLFAHYQFDDNAANFHSSDTTLNAVWELCKYSMKATSYLGTYVDGDRERVPYEADAYINQLSHCAVDREYTIARKTSEHLIYHPTWPTEWILQSVLIAWYDYLYTDDIRPVKHNYENLKAKCLTALADSTYLISTLNGKVTKDVLSSIHFNGELRDIVDWPHNQETDGFVFTKYNAVVNAYYYRALVLMKKMAEDLGKANDAREYEKRAVAVKKAFQKAFYDPKQKIYVDGDGTNHASLHTNMFALAFDLVDAEYRKPILEFIKSRGMACSVYGSQFLLDAVYNAGDGNYGLSLLTSKTDRSWYNMIRAGSTITMEAWDNKYKPNQDWNHAWGAAAANIISRKLMGVEPIESGWTSFRVKPQIGSLTQASIDVPTIKGTIKLSCYQTPKTYDIYLAVPANTWAEVELPIDRSKNDGRLFIDGKQLKSNLKLKNLINTMERIGSGNHHYKIEYF
ncbi:Bacterial alpha-L-rhamnosidase [Mucilaginibacter corticis]|uniref:alpha-L-rhamnosidase n=1 Tax=Mucilaginibacter corticis TaxID=2597670 RepID=A0A556ML51_9SPHI|nr:family 78 glycoside hydrolase catalytic domain [Mucilaginibacter corticis]TSJ40657.1 Bacterial alpha-L-rhamnosidase [Mucilaginibacter corticis]